MYIIFECMALVGLTFTFGILLFGFCALLLMSCWGLQKAARRLATSAADRGCAPQSRRIGREARTRDALQIPNVLRPQFASNAPSVFDGRQGRRPESAPHLLQ